MYHSTVGTIPPIGSGSERLTIFVAVFENIYSESTLDLPAELDLNVDLTTMVAFTSALF